MKAPLFILSRNPGLLVAGILLLLSQGCGQKSLAPSQAPALAPETLQPPTVTLALTTGTNLPPPATPTGTLPVSTATEFLPTATVLLPAFTPADRTLSPQFLARLNLGRIEAIALSPQRDWLVAASASHICLFDTTRFEQAWCKPTELPSQFEAGGRRDGGAQQIVLSLAFHPGGEQFAYALWNGYLVFRDRATGQRLNVIDTYFLNWIRHLAWSQDGKRMIIHTKEHGIDFLDTSTGEQEGHLDIDPDRIAGLAWSPDNHVLAVGMKDEGKINLWNTDTLEQTGSVKIASLGGVYDIVWSPDGKTLYTSVSAMVSDCGGQCEKSVGWVKAWDMTTGKLAFEVDVGEDVVATLAVSTNGKWLAAGSGYWSVKVFDGVTGDEAARQPRTGSSYGMVWLEEDRLVYPADSGERDAQSLSFLDVKTGEQSDRFMQGFEDINSLAWLPDGERLVTDSAGGTLSIWQARTGQRLEQFRFRIGKDFLHDFSSASVSLVDGRLASSAEGSIRIVNVETREVLQTLEYPDRDSDTHVGETSWSGDGMVLAGQVYGSGKTNIAVWNAQTGELLLTIPVENPQHVTDLTLSPDGTRLALGWFSAGNGRLIVWDVVKNQEIVSIDIPCALFRQIRWFSDYRVALATTSGIEIWDINAKKQLRVIDSEALHAFSPDGSLVVTSHGIGGITIRDFSSGKALANLEMETVYITNAAFSPDGKLLASLTDQGSVIIWDMSEFYHR
jgi:WD40 repeat protein